MEGQVLEGGQGLVEEGAMAQERRLPPHGVRVAAQVVGPSTRDLAPVGPQRGGEHAQQGGLARAVPARRASRRAPDATAKVTSTRAKRRP